MTDGPYIVRVADNYHHGDESETYTRGSFATKQEAVAECRRIVDLCLENYRTPTITGIDLYLQYTLFGDDPFVIGPDSGDRFSAWDYARERCEQITGQQIPHTA